jgi:hypothetical protein
VIEVEVAVVVLRIGDRGKQAQRHKGTEAHSYMFIKIFLTVVHYLPI